MSESQQTTLVGLARTISGQIGIIIRKMRTILVQNSELKILLMIGTQTRPKRVVVGKQTIVLKETNHTKVQQGCMYDYRILINQ